MFCSQCGQRLEVGMHICPSCQTSVGKPVNDKTLGFQGRAGKDKLEPAGLISALFDFSFESLITLKIIKFLFIICVGIAGLLTLVIISSGFEWSPGIGILFLFVVGPLFFLFSVIYIRVLLELVAVLFRIQANTGELVKHARMERD